MKLKELVEDTLLEEKSSEYPFHISRVMDKVFLDSPEFMNSLKDIPNNLYATDYAVMNGVILSNLGKRQRKEVMHCPLREFNGKYLPVVFDRLRGPRHILPNCYNLGVYPSMHIKLDAVISEKNLVKFGEVKNIRGNILYHTMELGAFPKNFVDDKLEKFLTEKISSLRKTGKTYSGYFDINTDKFIQNEEYEYNGEKYVLARAINEKNNLDGSSASSTDLYRWFKVEPITWQIRNWQDLPKTINPKGNGNAKYIDIRSEEAILPGMPFFTEYINDNVLWQNTYIRAYLNGYDLHAEMRKGNGNVNLALNTNYVFEKGFLDEAFEGNNFLQGYYTNINDAKKDKNWQGNYLELE